MTQQIESIRTQHLKFQQLQQELELKRSKLIEQNDILLERIEKQNDVILNLCSELHSTVEVQIKSNADLIQRLEAVLEPLDNLLELESKSL